MSSRPNILLATMAVLASSLSARGESPNAGELTAAKQWAQTALLAEKAAKPFSFVYGGKSSGGLLGEWKLSRDTRGLDAQRREHTLTWTDPTTGLQVP